MVGDPARHITQYYSPSVIWKQPQSDGEDDELSLFLCSLGEAPCSGTAALWLRPSGGGPSWAGVRPELLGPLRSSGYSRPAKDLAGPALQRADPRSGTRWWCQNDACWASCSGSRGVTSRPMCACVFQVGCILHTLGWCLGDYVRGYMLQVKRPLHQLLHVLSLTALT